MDIYQELGIQPVINAMGTVTILGGSIMPAEVLQAMISASASYVDIHELHQAAGRKIAGLIGVDAAHVCACASAGITLMAAACMAGSDLKTIARLPDTRGLRNQFVVQRAQRNGFDHGIELAGGKLVEIEADPAELRAALNEQTAAVFYTHAWSLTGKSLPLAETAQIAHTQNIPLILDAAAEVPPVENLSRFIKEGADLVVFSGGKAIRGPQSSGVILGRKALIEACAANDSPNVNSLARGMKAGKEEIAGLVKAIELYLKQDHVAEMAQWVEKAAFLVSEFSQVPGLKAERQLPHGVGQLVPHVTLEWDEKEKGITYEQAANQLRQGQPAIAVRLVEGGAAGPAGRQIWACVQTLRDGEEQLVARQIIKILSKD